MKRIQKYWWKTECVWNVFFGALLILQVLLWAGLNLGCQYVNDHDSAKVLFHAMRMWEEKALLIPGWKYVSTAELDCAALPALVLYGITDNILLSFAIANTFHVLLFSLILLKLLRNLGLNGKYAYITVSIILIPFGTGMLSYANMLFYGAAQYVYKTLLPIWMLELLTSAKGSWKKWNWRMQWIGFCALVFLTSVSSGLYVFICGLFPIMVCNVMFLLHGTENRQWTEQIATCLAACIMTLTGYVVQKAVGLSTYADQMNLVTLGEFFSKLEANFTNLLELARALPEQQISLYTFGGMMYVVRLAFLMCVLILGLQGLKGWGEIEERNEIHRFAGAALSGVFVWNICIQQLTVSSARYHLIGYVSLMISAGIVFAIGERKKKTVSRYIRLACAAMLMLIMMAGCWRSVYSYAGNNYEVYFNEVSHLAEEQKADSVVFVNDSMYPEIARVFDSERTYVGYFTANRSLWNYDTYDYYDDRSGLTDRHLLIATEQGGLSVLPQYLQGEYREIGEVFGDKVYLAESCWLDGTAGPIARRTAIDYPYTQGYLFDESMSPRGFFPAGKRRTVVQSPIFGPYSQEISVTIHYRLKDGEEGAWLEADLSAEAPLHIAMKPDKKEIVFHIPEGNAFSFQLILESGTELDVKQIEFDGL